jgi:hypothetical protein
VRSSTTHITNVEFGAMGCENSCEVAYCIKLGVGFSLKQTSLANGE